MFSTRRTFGLALSLVALTLACGGGGGGTTDTTPPAILSTTPDSGATAVSRTAVVQIRFSEAIAPASVTRANVTWQDASSASVDYIASFYSPTNTLSLAPSAPLANYRGQTVVVGTGITDVAGNHLASARTVAFTTADTVAPDAPAAPTDAGAYSAAQVVFGWAAPADDGSGVASYDVVVARATDGTLQAFSGNVGNVTSFTFDAPLFDGQTLYAQVRAVDAAGNVGSWSGFSDGVVVDATGPVASAPTDAGVWEASPVHLGWADAADAGSGVASYVLEIATGPDAALVIAQVPNAARPYAFDASALSDGVTLYARVAAVDAVGNAGAFSGWSDGVLLDAAPPTVPGTPVDGGVATRETTARFDWSPSTDAVSGVASYVIQVATANDGTGALIEPDVGDVTSFTYSGSAGQTLYARVAAKDAAGHASTFSTFSDGIRIGADVPAAPAPPTDAGPYSASDLLVFQWATPATWGSGAPDHYVLEAGTSPGASDVVAGASVPPGGALTQYTVDASAVPNGATVYARVAAASSLGEGAFSASSDGMKVDRTDPTAPGTPTDRGAFAGRYVAFAWSAASDPESGIASYEIEVSGDGSVIGTFGAATTSYTFDASGLEGRNITARVRATDGAGRTSSWSGPSDGVVVDMTPPSASATPGNGWVAATSTDVVLDFSEPMDRASVEQALSLTWGSGTAPAHGLAFYWSADGKRATVVPDTQDPPGITNVDLLPEAQTFHLALPGSATDLAGNPLSSPVNVTFTTVEQQPPSLVSLTVGGHPSPVPPASVQPGGFTVVATFDEDMDSSRGRIELPIGNTRISGRYDGVSLWGATGDGTNVGYRIPSCPDIRAGDVVTVTQAYPPSFDAVRAPVVSMTSLGDTTCLVTVANPTTETWMSGGWLAYPSGQGARIAWTGPRTLALAVEPWVSIAPGAEVSATVSDVSDVNGNYGWARAALQVATLPGADAAAPRVIASAPSQGAAGEPPMRPVLVRFSEPLDRSSLAGVTVSPDLYEIRYDPGQFGALLVLVPRRAPAPGASVVLHVPSDVRDLAGNALGTAYDLSFTVGAGTGTGAPVLAESIPPDGLPVDQVWQAEMAFAGGAGGPLDPIDPGSLGPEDVLVVDQDTGVPFRGFRPEVDPGSAFVRLVPPPRTSGLSTAWSSGGPVGRHFRIAVGVPAGLGGTGVADAFGNAMAEQSFVAWIEPAGPTNRVPIAQSLRDVRASGATSPAGRTLSVQTGVRDDDGQPVTVTVGSGATAFPGLTRTLSSGSWYSAGGDGPPAGTLPPELGNPGFAASGFYPITVTLDDGLHQTSYVREAFLWAPGDLPSLAGIQDGATFRAVDAARPILVRDTATPTLQWTGVDAVNADFAAAYLVEAAGVGDGAPGAYVEQVPLPPGATGLTAPRPLDPDLYLWTVVQMRFGHGTTEPVGQGWALDLGALNEATFLYGPENGSLSSASYGVAEIALARDRSTGALASLAGATGTWSFDPYAGGEPPIALAASLVDNAGNPVTASPQYFAVGGGRLAVTRSVPGPFPVTDKGLLGRSGALLAVAQTNEWLPALTAGARRFRTSGFPTSLSAVGASWVYAQMEATVAAGGTTLQSVGGSVGDVTADAPSAGLLTVVGTNSDGSAFTAPGVPYTLAADGLFRLDVGGPTPGVQFASGLVGGASGAEIIAVESNGTPDRVFWLLTARARAWTGTESAADLAGEYRLVDLGVGRDGATGAVRDAGATVGRGTFDGAGGLTFEVRTSGGAMTGTGTYTVDAVAHRVTLAVPGSGGMQTITLVAGPDFDTLIGVSTSNASGNRAEAIVLSR